MKKKAKPKIKPEAKTKPPHRPNILSRKVYSDEHKKLLATQALMKRIESPAKSVKAIAREIGVRENTLRLFLQRDEKWKGYLQEQKLLFDAQALEALQSGIKRMKEKIATGDLRNVTIAVGVLHDKVFGTSPVTEVHTGDKVVKVYYPRWDESRREYEAETGQMAR